MLASMFLGVHFLAGMTNLTLSADTVAGRKRELEKKTQLQTEELAHNSKLKN